MCDHDKRIKEVERRLIELGFADNHLETVVECGDDNLVSMIFRPSDLEYLKTIRTVDCADKDELKHDLDEVIKDAQSHGLEVHTPDWQQIERVEVHEKSVVESGTILADHTSHWFAFNGFGICWTWHRPLSDKEIQQVLDCLKRSHHPGFTPRSTAPCVQRTTNTTISHGWEFAK